MKKLWSLNTKVLSYQENNYCFETCSLVLNVLVIVIHKQDLEQLEE